MHHYLNAHPEIFMSSVKEPHRFGSDLELGGPRYESMRSTDPTAYLELFADAGDCLIRGEASPGYLCSSAAPAEIDAFSPDARALIMLRPPAEVVISMHNLFLNSGNEDLEDLNEALDAESDRANGDRFPAGIHSRHGLYYLRNVQFADDLERWWSAWGRERVKVVLLEDLRADVASTYSAVTDFLGVDQNYRPDFEVVNASKMARNRSMQGFLRNPPELVRRLGRVMRPVADPALRMARSLNSRGASRPEVSAEIRGRLDRQLAPQVHRLETLLERDLSHWLTV